YIYFSHIFIGSYNWIYLWRNQWCIPCTKIQELYGNSSLCCKSKTNSESNFVNNLIPLLDWWSH
ncbi:hypothetical protein, partial [Cryptosporidium parvum Iowa II]